MLSAANYIDDPTVPAGKTHVMYYSRNWPWRGPSSSGAGAGYVFDPLLGAVTPDTVRASAAAANGIPSAPMPPQPPPYDNYGIGNMRFLLFAASISIAHVSPLVQSQSTLPSGRSALFTRYEGGTADYHMIAAEKDFADFNMTIYEQTKDSGPATWLGGKTPDPTMNAVFYACRDFFTNGSGTSAFEIKVGSERFIASAGRLIIPKYDINWLMYEYTPYESTHRTRTSLVTRIELAW